MGYDRLNFMSELLDIVDENDKVVGQAERDEVHSKGLVCRLIYVCFYTSDGKIILQKRSDNKKNDPGKLITTVSGHVGSGQSYAEAVVRETAEETAITIDVDNLVDLGPIRIDYEQNGYISKAMRRLYIYNFEGNITDLQVEADEGAGFVAMSIEEFKKSLRFEPAKFAKILSGKLGDQLIDQFNKTMNTL